MALTFAAYAVPGRRGSARSAVGRGRRARRRQLPRGHPHGPAHPGHRRRRAARRCAVVVAAVLHGGDARHLRPSSPTGGGPAAYGVLQSAGLLFFAFAGYARIATLGEEVRDPARTIPRAISVALGHRGRRVRASSRSRARRARARGGSPRRRRRWPTRSPSAGSAWAVPVVRVGAAAASLGALLALIAGVGRTTLGHGARARPAALARRGPPALPGAAPRRGRGRRRRVRARAHRRPARRDRLLVVRRAALLRRRQRRRVHPDRAAQRRYPRALQVVGLDWVRRARRHAAAARRCRRRRGARRRAVVRLLRRQ